MLRSLSLDKKHTRPEDVLHFWFGPLDSDGLPGLEATLLWFTGGPDFDQKIRDCFASEVDAALRGECDEWARTPQGRLALVLLLDQFTRNIFRGTARAFAGDVQALKHASVALDRAEDQELRPIERLFLYMPFEHAEDRAQQTRVVSLCERLLEEASAKGRALFQGGLDYARRYQVVIDRFGRFPARNSALDRDSTPEEIEFLRHNKAGF